MRLYEAAWFLLAAVAWTWPMAADPGAATLGHPRADGLKHLWTLAWARREVWDQGRLPFHTDWVNWPVGLELFPIEPLNGLVAVLLPWIGLIPLANLLVLLNLWGTGLAGAYFGRQVAGRDEGGWVAGTLLQGSAVSAWFVHLGVGELHHLWWLPLGLGLLVRARRTLRPGAFVALGLCLAGATLSGFYIGFFLAFATAVWALLTLDAGRGTGRLALGYLLAASLGLALILPVLAAFGGSWTHGTTGDVGLLSWVFGPHDQPLTDPPSARLEPLHLLWPGRALSGQQEAYGGGRYLGLVALGLGALGLARRPREGLPWVVVGALGAVLALGSALVWRGEELVIDGQPVRLPFLWLNRALGYVVEPINFPARALAISAVALSALGALGARGRLAWLALPAVLEIALLQEISWPWRSFRPDDARALAAVADHQGHGLVDLALVWRPDAENRWSALSAQLVHRHPTQAVPIERVEYFARDGARYVAALRLARDLEPLYNRQTETLAGSPEDYRADLALLRDAGFHEILVNYRGGRERIPDGLVASLSGLCGPPLVLESSRALWAVPEQAASPEELAAWRATHVAAVESLAASDYGPGPSW